MGVNHEIDECILEPIAKENEFLIEEHIYKLVSKRKVENKEYDGRCVLCDNQTPLGCDYCKKVNYCSTRCQALDWEKHSKECNSSSKNSIEESKTRSDFKVGGDVERRSDNRQSRFENADNNRGQFDQQDNNRDCGRNNQSGGKSHYDNKDRRFGNRNETPRYSGGRNNESPRAPGFDERKPMPNKVNGENGVEQNRNSPRNESHLAPLAEPTWNTNQSPEISKKEISNAIQEKKVDSIQDKPQCQSRQSFADVKAPESSAAQHLDFPPEEVQVISSESDAVYVVDKKNIEKYEKLLSDVAFIQKPFTPFTPVESGICAAEFDGILCRCQITNLNPLTITYIDFGNSENVTPDRLLSLPETLASMESCVMKIKPTNCVKYEETDEFTMKRLKKENDYWVCQVLGKGEEGAQTLNAVAPTQARAPEEKPSVLPKVIEQPTPSKPVFNKLLPPDTFTKVSVVYRNGQNLSVTPLDKVQDLKNLSEKVQKEAERAGPINVQPSAKCLTKWPKDGKWYRGRILSVEPLSVLLVDLGLTITCSPGDLRALSPQLLSSPLMVFLVRPKDGNLNVKNKFAVKPRYKDQSNTWIVDVEELPEEIIQPKHQITASPSKTQATMAFPPILKPDVFTTVIVTNQNTESGAWDYCVGNKVFFDTYLEMANHFQKFVPSCGLLTPALGAVGLRFAEGSWNRVKVVNLSPLEVIYLEFGNVEGIAANDLKQCPDTHKEIPPLGYKIKLAEGTDDRFLSLPVPSELSVKPFSMLPDGTVVVHVEGVVYSTQPSPSATSTPISNGTKESFRPDTTVESQTEEVKPVVEPTRSEEIKLQSNYSQGLQHGVVALLQPGWKVQLIPNTLIDEGSSLVGTLYTGKIPTSENLVNGELSVIIEEQLFVPMFKPKEGEIVGIQEKSEWCRAQLISDEYVLMIDYCKIKKMSKVKKLPSKALETPKLGVEFTPLNLDLLQDMFDEVELVLTVDSVRDGAAQVSWRGMPAGELHDWRRQPAALAEPINDGVSVVITTCCNNPAAVTVAPIDETFDLIQSVQIVCQRMVKEGGQTLTEPPKVGEYVTFMEGNSIWHRSKVEKVDEQECYMNLIDFGIHTKAPISSLYPLPSSLLKIPCGATTVTLSGVKNESHTIESKEYLEKLIETEELFEIKWENKIFGLVTLSNKNGEIINKKMLELLDIEAKPDSRGKLTLNSIPKALPPMNVMTNFIVTSADHPKTLYMAEYSVFMAFNGHNSVHNQIHAYCTKTDVRPYNPSRDELCLANYEGEWYRCRCLKETPSGVSTVMLIDYGNIAEVPFADIRQITSEFLKEPPMALPVRFKGLPREVTTGLKKALDENVGVYEQLSGVVSTYNEDGEFFEVDCPSLSTILNC